MEQSAFEAVLLGVNVFVFVAALSAGVLLMSNVLDMVNFANERAIVGMNGSLAESVGEVTERIYTGAQMLNYYRDEIEAENLESLAFNYKFSVKLSKLGQEQSLKRFVQSDGFITYINKEFVLEYKGIDGDKHAYVFSLKEE